MLRIVSHSAMLNVINYRQFSVSAHLKTHMGGMSRPTRRKGALVARLIHALSMSCRNTSVFCFLVDFDVSTFSHPAATQTLREKENVITIKENVMVNQWQASVHQGERSSIKPFHLDQRASALMNQLFHVIKRWSLNTTLRWQIETVRSKRRKNEP